ncbi:MAG: HD domain-containing protein [Bacilli bacterium]|nr:HD domain-containing protein [Bacilli bacterium]
MLEEAFDKYVSSYNINDSYIKLKYNHSYRVMKLQEKYAKKLGFSEEDIELARVIGLLHDIGRFEQMKVFGNDDDSKTIDHADYSCVQLFDKGEIKRFVKREEWYPIIEFAIKNHNKRVLENNPDERAMMHAKLIRDTDKIDIIFLIGKLREVDVTPTKDKIHKRVLNEFYKHKVIAIKDIKNLNDHIVLQYSFVYDVNYPVCLKELKKNFGYYFEVQKNNKEIENVYNYAMNYIEERLEK